MKARTKIEVTYNVPVKVTERATSFIEGEIVSVRLTPIVQVDWRYKSDLLHFMQGSKTIPNEVADLILGANPINSIEKANEVFYETLRQEMATTFGISVNDIEIVD
jgi:hypothetical protein